LVWPSLNVYTTPLIVPLTLLKHHLNRYPVPE
jgi:uncharacterized protein YbgA (DUF1722 family)